METLGQRASSPRTEGCRQAAMPQTTREPGSRCEDPRDANLALMRCSRHGESPAWQRLSSDWGLRSSDRDPKLQRLRRVLKAFLGALNPRGPAFAAGGTARESWTRLGAHIREQGALELVG